MSSRKTFSVTAMITFLHFHTPIVNYTGLKKTYKFFISENFLSEKLDILLLYI